MAGILGLGPRKLKTHRNWSIGFKTKEKPMKNEEKTSSHVENSVGKTLKKTKKKAHPQEEC